MDSTEEKEKRRAKFMADVSHDMKTPLNAVIGFTSVLLQDREELGTEKTRQLELVYKSAHRLLGRVDALTEFFRLQAGVTGADADWFSPRQLIEETLDLFREDAKEKGIRLETGSGTMPSRMRSASRLISRALRELVANAVKFDVSGSVSMDLRIEEGVVAFRVADGGAGLSAGSLQKLKEALGPRDTYDGLGLGLALAREVARALGGRIEVESQSDRGSTFTLVFELTGDNLEM
jgi:signal transduction histidine kinase